MQMTDWDDIRFFLAVAREGSISAASRSLGVNHSTVSRRIHGFEEKHGVRLFERTSDGWDMSEAASAIYELALEIESNQLQLGRMLLGQDAMLRGAINLTLPHDIFEFCLTDDVREFNQLYPEVELNLLVAKGLKNLANREADIAIRMSPSPPEYLIGREITKLQVGIYSSTKVNIEEGVGLVVWSDENQVPDWAREHFPGAKINLRVDDLYSMYVAVKAGFGIARMPCYMPDSLVDQNVYRLSLELPPSNWGLWVLSHVDLRKTARIQCCKQFLIEALEKKKGLFRGEESYYG